MPNILTENVFVFKFHCFNTESGSKQLLNDLRERLSITRYTLLRPTPAQLHVFSDSVTCSQKW